MSTRAELDEKLRNFGKDLGAAPPAEEAPKEDAPKKRGRPKGSTKKKKEEAAPPPPPEPEIMFDEPDMGMFYGEGDDFPMDYGGGDNVPLLESSPEEIAKKAEMVSTINLLKTKCNVKGTNMHPHEHMPAATLLEEIKLLNDEINARRGDGILKTSILSILPIIEAYAPKFIPQSEMDLTGLSDVVKEEWDTLFKDAATQIAVNNRSLLSPGPYMTLALSLKECATITTLRNRGMRAMAERQEAAQRDL